MHDLAWIDLGTSNSAVAADDFAPDETVIVEVTQILRPNQVGEQTTLPSALYIPHPDEFPAGALKLPWSDHSNPRLSVTSRAIMAP